MFTRPTISALRKAPIDVHYPITGRAHISLAMSHVLLTVYDALRRTAARDKFRHTFIHSEAAMSQLFHECHRLMHHTAHDDAIIALDHH